MTVPRATLSKLSDRELSSLLGSETALLFGSYASVFAPTGLPSGVQVANAICDLLFPGGSSGTSWPDWFRQDFGEVPFEAVLDAYPDQPQLPSVVASQFNSKTSNPIHKSIGEAFLSGGLKVVITTNYDLGLEATLHGSVQRIVGEPEAQGWLNASKPVFGSGPNPIHVTSRCP